MVSRSCMQHATVTHAGKYGRVRDSDATFRHVKLRHGCKVGAGKKRERTVGSAPHGAAAAAAEITNHKVPSRQRTEPETPVQISFEAEPCLAFGLLGFGISRRSRARCAFLRRARASETPRARAA